MKTKSHKTETRGRKPGDGILKGFDRDASPLEKQVRLTYGQTAGNRLAERVRWFRHWRSMAKDSRNREFVDKRTRDLLERFQHDMVNALWDFKPDWFQQMADAITTENEAARPGPDAYARQKALLEIAGAPKIRRADLIHPENAAGDAASLKARYTIAELCKLLEKRYRVKTDDRANLERAVRRDCDEIGIPYLLGKPGRPRKNH